MSRSLVVRCCAGLLFGALAGSAVRAESVAPADPKDAARPALRRLDPALPWYGDNRQRLDEFIARTGRQSPGYRAERPPVATFDWDNTLIRNDIGDATVFWALRNDKVLQPPLRSWRLVNHLLTAEGVAALSAACDDAAAPGQPLPTATNRACASEIITIYVTSKTVAGQAAFTEADHRRMEPSYAFGVQLLGGHSFAEVKDYTRRALDQNLAAPVGATQSVGSRGGLLGWIRFYDQQRDLIGTLRDNGFDVWVVSASPQPVAEAAAERLGFPADHVIGVRLIQRGGRFSYDLAGCGDVPDGQNTGGTGGGNIGNGLLNYIDGKRCWINKVIFGVSGAAALQRSADPHKRPAFAAGDADTDLTMLQDAGMRLVINRNFPALLCSAYGGARGAWLVNPMFLSPLPQQLAPYPCATRACKDSRGAAVPCRDEDGRVIPDQIDRVFSP